MARPCKTGLDYFPLDVDFFNDLKMRFITARFGIKGQIIVVRLLCEIYKNGYYLEWNEDVELLFQSELGSTVTLGLTAEVLAESLKRGLVFLPASSRLIKSGN